MGLEVKDKTFQGVVELIVGRGFLSIEMLEGYICPEEGDGISDVKEFLMMAQDSKS